MIIIPAIDLKNGEVVRLTKGVMNSAKIYSDTPYKIALEFEKMGAEWLHIVDLNGAFAGEPKNLEAIKNIRKYTNLKIELGGGIRDEETIKKYLDLGIDRLILGSIAQKKPKFVKELADKFPIIVGIDAINGYVAVEGWGEVSKIKATLLAKEFENSNIQAIISTDIGRDGTLDGINLEFTESITKSSKLPVIASGGLKNMEDLEKISKSNLIAGVIVGKSFYEGTLNLKEAFQKFS
jgi:phosphoribosylformimino-5-aminoimidazole carboxamide ribotide isomerase